MGLNVLGYPSGGWLEEKIKGQNPHSLTMAAAPAPYKCVIGILVLTEGEV